MDEMKGSMLVYTKSERMKGAFLLAQTLITNSSPDLRMKCLLLGLCEYHSLKAVQGRKKGVPNGAVQVPNTSTVRGLTQTLNISLIGGLPWSCRERAAKESLPSYRQASLCFRGGKSCEEGRRRGVQSINLKTDRLLLSREQPWLKS